MGLRREDHIEGTTRAAPDRAASPLSHPFLPQIFPRCLPSLTPPRLAPGEPLSHPLPELHSP